MTGGSMRRVLFIPLVVSLAGIVHSQEVKPAEKGEVRLTAAALGTVLENLGYDPKDLGNGIYEVIVDREGWKVYLTLDVSPSGDIVWIGAEFPTIANPDTVPASVWVA